MFIMQKSYKDIQTYIDGLQYTLDNFTKYLPDFYLRIYYDASVEQDENLISLFKEARQHEKVQLVKFVHPWFANKQGYHLGTFGTIVRLYPLFDNAEPNLKTVLIGDVDYNDGMFPYWQNTYKFFKKSRSQVHMFARDCNQLNERVKKIVDYLNISISPFLNSFWTKIRFPSIIMDTFLKCLHDETHFDSKEGCEEVKLFLTKTDFDKVKKANRMDKQRMMYGVDEICLLILVKHVINNSIPYSYHVFPDLLIPFRDAYANDSKLINTQEHKDIIKQMMKKYYNHHKSTHYNFNSMYIFLNTYDTYLLPLAQDKKKLLAYFTNNIRDVYKHNLCKNYETYSLAKDTVFCVYNSTLTGLKLMNMK